MHGMLKLIEEDGDSFAKRAEMYYKRRPELIESVEDTYRAFKALADRYDLLSKELQNANHTIATVFPEQVQFAMDAEEESPNSSPAPKNVKNFHNKNVPKVPKASMDSLKGFINTASKQFQPKKPSSKPTKAKPRPKTLSMSKDEALHEINKVNKEILALQTIREFCKTSYETGLAKFYELENQIMEKQERVSRLQDEYEVESVIEDGEARTLMAEAALKSCKEALSSLQEKQHHSTIEANDEFIKIQEAREHVDALRKNCVDEHNHDDDDHHKSDITEEDHKSDEDVSGLLQELNDMDTLTSDKSFDLSSKATLTVTQLAEKIDQLVNKVVGLETAVSSQTVLINTLRTEADDLHSRLKNLESEKEALLNDTRSLSSRIKELEDKLSRLEELNKSVEAHNTKLEANFAHCRCSLDHLSEKLTTVRPDEEAEESDSSYAKHKDHKKKKDKKEKKEKKDKKEKKEKKDKKDKKESHLDSEKEITDQKDPQRDVVPTSGDSNKLQKEIKDERDVVTIAGDGKETKHDVKEVDASVKQAFNTKQDEVSTKPVRRSITFSGETTKERVSVLTGEAIKAQGEEGKVKESDLNWQQMLLNGTEDREKILLREYTTILRNYKDVKRKLSETEKKERDIQFDITLQMRELKQAILKRDQEIQHLRNELSLLQGNKNTKNEGDLPSNSPVHQSAKLEPVDQSAKPEPVDHQSAKPVSVDRSANPEAIDLMSAVHESDSEVFEDCDVEGKVEEVKLIFKVKPTAVSAVEEKLRMEIDAILDENLDFWLRFSTAFHQVQKFKSEAQDLLDEISKLKDKKKQEGCMTAQLKSEVRPIYKHLREIQTELTVWLEQRACLKDELKHRFTSLCSIQEEITRALNEGVEEEEIRFSSHQAAKLQGEILNMKQENNKVREELQTCLDHVSVLQLDIEKTLRQLNQEFSICTDQPQLHHTMSRSKVPLRSFIFGTKVKKQKSLFNFMHANRKFQAVRALPNV